MSVAKPMARIEAGRAKRSVVFIPIIATQVANQRTGGAAYAIDDQTAIKVVDRTVEVISEGYWKLFAGVRKLPGQEASH